METMGVRGIWGLEQLERTGNFIESLWDWPVAPHIQRVILFGMLPLITWVLAGMVENAVGVMLGMN